MQKANTKDKQQKYRPPFATKKRNETPKWACSVCKVSGPTDPGMQIPCQFRTILLTTREGGRPIKNVDVRPWHFCRMFGGNGALRVMQVNSALGLPDKGKYKKLGSGKANARAPGSCVISPSHQSALASGNPSTHAFASECRAAHRSSSP